MCTSDRLPSWFLGAFRLENQGLREPVRVDRLPVLMEYLRALLSDCHSQDHQVHRVKQTESQAPNLRPKWHGQFTSPSALRRLHVVTHQLRRRPVASVLRKPFVNWSFDCWKKGRHCIVYSLFSFELLSQLAFKLNNLIWSHAENETIRKDYYNLKKNCFL